MRALKAHRIVKLVIQLLMKKIGLKDAPCPKYSPVAGAALMAQMS